MRILAFTFEAPTRIYGGGIGIIQSLSSLSKCGEVHYVGPRFDPDKFEEIQLDKISFLEDNNSFIKKFINLLRGVSVKYYQEWKKVVKTINPKDYDLVFIDFTYNDFIMKWAHENGLKVIARVHNIERDMSINTIKGSKHDKYWIKNIVNGRIIIRRERQLMERVEKLIFLTREDLQRGCELYGDSIREKSYIVPVCMDSEVKENTEFNSLKKPYILATGSLYYGPNADGIKWFINNVWENLLHKEEFNEYSFVVAGRNPDESLKRCINNSNRVILIDSPEDIYPYFINANIYVAPVFSGAGMKVKVAEALSYGLCVVGSHHALIGYEEAVPFVLEASTTDEFVNALLEMLKSTFNKEDCVEKYKSLYTLSRSQKDFQKITNELFNE